MAKHLLLNVLVKVLGEFVDLNEENLSLAVWSGQIALTNVRLKTDKILRDFNLEVHHGTIQKLDITIPWATLRTNPVKISISGILLDVGPLDVAKLGKVEALRRYMADKLRKLKLVDQYLELTLSLDGDKEKGKDQTYLQQSQLYWTSKLVDNIEIKISSMHVRYEDSISIPGKVFAAGITLHSFSISARDASW
ncbi:N-terminal region of Chorein, a TM vesicle-mediated sorter-domain-containing protein, partial [Ochromonadaceae sp. CCMP2298]